MNLTDRLFYAMRKILFLWVRTEVINLAEIDTQKPVYYVLPTQSLSDHCTLEQECLRLGLPSSCAQNVLYLNSTNWFGRKKTRLEKLKQLMSDAQLHDIQIVPVTILWGRSRTREESLIKALLSATWSQIGTFQKSLMVILHGRQTLVQFSRAISLQEFIQDSPEPNKAAKKLTRILGVHFRLVRTAVIGPDLSHRRTLLNSLVFSPSVRHAIEIKSKNNKKLVKQTQKEARAIANEIAANYSYAILRFMDILLTWLWNKLYNGINTHHLDRLQEIAPHHEIVYVPCHRSHIDYLLLSYVLQRNGLMVPHIAAGINLNMPIVGAILRRSGAFFMRRTFTNKLYTAVFDEYMHKIIQRGYSIEYFIEGGRSRTGRLRPPKTGMLSFTLRSFLRDHKRSIAFMPVYISYEKIFEGSTYLNELRGQAKKDETLVDMLSTIKQLKENYGKVAVNFGQPIYLAEFMDSDIPNWHETNYMEDEKPSWMPALLDNLAITINQRINSAAVTNPTSLVALALLSAPQQALPEKTLLHLLDHYRMLLEKMPYSEEMVIAPGCSAEWVTHTEKEMQLLVRTPHVLGDMLQLTGETAVLMTYYRNNILHLFALPSVIACLFNNQAILSKAQITLFCETIYPYLQGELYLRWSIEELPNVIEKYLSVFAELGLIQRAGSRYRRNEAGTTIPINLSLLAQAILPTLERFYIAFTLLSVHGSGNLKISELEKSCQDIAERLSILHGLHAPEFCDKSLFTQFIQLLRDNRLLITNEDRKLVFGEVVDRIMTDAKLVLAEDIRLSILDMAKQ
jgi:glycerol-3-phosphate O-acyltransferase